VAGNKSCTRKWNDNPELRAEQRLDLYRAFPVPNGQNPLTQTDLLNAIALMEHLLRCHRAALEIPGVNLALLKHRFVSPIDGAIEEAGIHCDHAYSFIENLLHAAQRWCAEQIKDPPSEESPKAISAPSAMR